MSIVSTRRGFLVTTSSMLAALAVDPGTGKADSRPLPTGPVYGRVGGRGLKPGMADRPALGEVVLLDGRTLPVRHVAACRVAPGKSVWLSPAADGVFSVLYAEV